MRGGSFLRYPLPKPISSGNGATPIRRPGDSSEQIAAAALRATTSLDDLQSVWWRDAEAFTGEARERLQDIYRDQMLKMGSLHP